MMPTLRRAILEARPNSVSVAKTADARRDGTTEEAPVKDKMLRQLQRLFAALDESVKQFYNPDAFCQEFTDFEGNPIDALEQMDVDEFFNMLTDKLETALKDTTKAGVIGQHFGGVFSNQIICKDCPHRSEHDEPFSAINLQIKNKKSLHECLTSFVEGETMEGNNAYHCDRCDKKVAAVKRVCIKSLPRHLIFVLKRFSYNYDLGQKVKLNDFCEFPMQLNMEPYTVDYLSRKSAEKDKEAEQSATSMRDGSTTEVSPSKASLQPQNCDYRLVGIIIHRGTADGGHYYSLIMDRERNGVPETERWFEFNDKNVDKFPYDSIGKEAFGGEDNEEGRGGRWKRFERMDNAYMLFYERKDPADCPRQEPAASKRIRDEILRENVRYWQAKLLFGEDYFNFLTQFGLTWDSSLLNVVGFAQLPKPRSIKVSPEERLPLVLSGESLSALQLRVFEYIATAAMTTMARARNHEHLYAFAELLKLYMQQNYTAARWIITAFSNRAVLAEFLFTDSPVTVKAVTTGILHEAAVKVSEKEKASMGTGLPQNCLPNYVTLVFDLLPVARTRGAEATRYCKLLADIAELGPEIRTYMNSIEAMQRICYFVRGTPETEQKLKMALVFHENPNCEFAVHSFPEKDGSEKSQSDYSFAVECLATLWRSCAPFKQGSESPLGLKPYAEFDKSTINAIISNKRALMEIIGNCTQRAALNSLMVALVHLAWESKVMKDYIKSAIVLGLEDDNCDYSEVHLFLRQVLLFARHPDSQSEEFLNDFLRELAGIFCKCQYAYYFTITSIEFLLKFSRMSPLIAKCLSQTFPAYEWILDYFKESPCPPQPSADWAVRLFKSGTSNRAVLASPQRYSLTQQEVAIWTVRSQKVVEALERVRDHGSGTMTRILRGVDPDPEERRREVDEDEDLRDEKFIPGMSIEYRYGSAK